MPHARHRAGDGEISQGAATGEGMVSNAPYGIGDGHICQRRAVRERAVPHAGELAM